MKQYFVGTKLIVIIMISCVLYSIYLWLEDLRCAFLHQIFIGIKTFYSYPLFENVYYWAAVAPSYGMGKIVDGSPRSRCMSHFPFNGADFCGEGTGHFRSSCECISKSIWKEQKIIAWSYWPYIYIYTVFDDVISLCGSRSNNALPWSPREILQLLLRVKSLAVQERNMLFVDRLVKQKHGHLS